MHRFVRILGMFAFVSSILTAMPRPAAAQGETGNVCVRDYQGGAVCTANDVRIEALTVVSVIEDCASGTLGETEIVFETLISSAGSPDRYDIGFFLALDGGSARDGDSCYHDYLEPPLTTTPTYGDKNSDMVDDITDGPWWDDDGDTCGDIETNTQLFKTLPALRFACIDTNGDGSADVSVCTSWDNNAGTACNAVSEAFPGTNAKCSCAGVELGIAPEPAITIVKSPASQNVLPGGTASFTFTVTGKTTISNVAVADSDCDAAPAFTGGDTDNDTILTPDETWTYACSKTGVMADFTNTVTVTGDGPLGAVNDADSADVTVSAATMTLAKSGVLSDGGDGVVDAGDSIVYTFLVTNTGTVTLTSVSVTDPLPGLSAITCPSGNPIPMLAIGASESCTATLVLSQADVDGGQIDNTATADSTEVGPVQDSESIGLPPMSALTLVKTGALDDGGDGVADAGDAIDYGFQVTNAGNVTIAAIGVSDPMIAPITCAGGNPIPSLAPGASVDCTGSYTLLQADVDAGVKDNTADATGQDPGGNPVGDTDSHSESLPAAPALTLVKTGTFNDESADMTAQAGETISYAFTVTNAGNQTLSNVAVTDPMVAPITCPSGNPIPSLAPGAGEVCTGSYTLVQGDVDAGQKVNTATAAGEDPGGNPVGDTDMATTPLTGGAPAVGAVKTSLLVGDNDSSGALSPGDDLLYTLVITNGGTADALSVVLTDVPDPNTALRVGTVTTTLGVVAMGNTAGDVDVTVDLGTLAAGGGQATVTFEVRIDDPLAAGVTEIVNQGIVSGSNFPNAFTDDPSTAPAEDPTAVPIVVGGGAPLPEIPTVSGWGFVLFVLLLAASAMAIMRRRSRPVR